MRRWTLVAVVLPTLVVGCNRKDSLSAWPPFTMTIPADTPELLIVTDKDGTEHQINGREAYAAGYKGGWKRCVWDFEQGDLDLAAKEPDVPLVQEYGIVVRGWEAGYLACWRAIREAKRAPGLGAAPGPASG